MLISLIDDWFIDWWLIYWLIDGLIDVVDGRLISDKCSISIEKISLLVNYLSRDNHYQVIKMSKGPFDVM